ncbi:hypothetical protein EHF36_10300 [Kerstersia gyiorum]|uniref:hypothetical protein n=1 Tax=Kerstersia gyiorum TaxID=206506 RepID=UPI001070B1B3|nr:hypothetical protein [Kerstersia gyiorum]QBR40975.1 hypothetical protein EHF36_10300 [Kerstersia gyiorum]
MKRLSHCQRKRHKRLLRIRTRHESLRKIRLIVKKRFLAQNAQPTTLHFSAQRFAKIRLSAPRIFSLIHPKWRGKLLAFLSQMRKSARCMRDVTIDLSVIKRLNPCGTLLFVAEVQRLIETFPNCRFRGNRPSDPVVEQLFQHIGLLKHLGVKSRLTISHRRVKDWTYHAGTRVDLTSLSSLQARLNDRLGEDLAFDLLGAMQEAITNAVHHAYIQVRPDGIKCSNQGWWVFAEQTEQGRVYLSVCDLGVGIRKTLPLRSPWPLTAIDAILSKLGKTTDLDAKYIKAALELGATRTGQGNRGKGLDEMLELVKSARSGMLRIFSDRGMYTFSGESGVEKILDYRHSIMGTLIQWSFDVKTIGARESKDDKND